MDDLEMLEPWLILQKIPFINLKNAHNLLQLFSSPEKILCAEPNLLDVFNQEQLLYLQTIKTAGEAHPTRQQVKKELAYLQNNNQNNNANSRINVITYNCQTYPLALKETQNAPLLLYVKGNPAILSDYQIAVVGARKASKSAKDLAYLWSAELAEQGLTITSGLALGIDGAAHQGTLSVKGNTIAVLAHGIDQIYPPQHQELSEEIIDSGALVTEFPLGMPPKKDHFPRRNRIISGLSFGVLVVEAALKSGSLITARYALEQNRDVFAVPGAINNFMAQGCHQLIKDGAYLVESVEDILQAMAWQNAKQQSLFENEFESDISPAKRLKTSMQTPRIAALKKEVLPFEILAPNTMNILQSIPHYIIHFDTIMENCAISRGELMTELLTLEMNGYIEMIAGNYQRIK